MDLFNALLDLIFPPKCLVCSALGNEPLCKKCISKIEYLSEDHSTGPNRSVAVYEGVIKDAIHKFKFQDKRSLGPALAKILIQYFRSAGIEASSIDVVTMVPLHPKRQKERGFNQSEFLALELAKEFGLRFRNDLLVKIRDTKPQFSLKREERFRNVEGAFDVGAKDAVAGRRILLIDDIFTTGATACECARALKGAGAKGVLVLTLCRAVDD